MTPRHFRITVEFDQLDGKSEPLVGDLCEAITKQNVRHLQQGVGWPLLYDSGVVYRLEVGGERFKTGVIVHREGHGDCEDLAALRAAELRVLGWRALRPGDPGYEAASVLKLPSLPATVVIVTHDPVGTVGGSYHCVVDYNISGQVFRDDPSVRLGMVQGSIDAQVLSRWQRAGVRARALPQGV